MRRLFTVLAIAFSLLGAGLLGIASASAATPPTHPFSPPVFAPLRVPFGVDCVKANPGCPSPHSYWQLDVVPSGQYGKHPVESHATIYAMGAGILHVGNAHGDACPAKDASFGTWVWIDHGAGTLSRYGHLDKILVKDGSYVKAGQAIGVVGDTGKGKNCGANYLDVEIQRGGGPVQANTIELKSWTACSRGKRVSYPQAEGYSVWNNVPQSTQFPATDSSCIPATPATPNAPSALKVKGGHSTVALSWAGAKGDSRIELSEHHTKPSAHWDYAWREKYVTTTAKHWTFSKLGRGTYRVRVFIYNGAGWSKAAGWRTVTVGS